MQPWECNGVINCGGVVVRPGDAIIGDQDGVVCVPASHAQQACCGHIRRTDTNRRMYTPSTPPMHSRSGEHAIAYRRTWTCIHTSAQVCPAQQAWSTSHAHVTRALAVAVRAPYSLAEGCDAFDGCPRSRSRSHILIPIYYPTYHPLSHVHVTPIPLNTVDRCTTSRTAEKSLRSSSKTSL